jgi:SAM-dependent methyltransferase
VHFCDEDVPPLLQESLAFATKTAENVSIVDLGCGDGRLIYALHAKSMLKHVKNFVGVDISETRIKRMIRQLPFVKGIVSDALCVKELEDCCFDFVICSQLIEHVKDDKKLIVEIGHLLKSGGLAYISSVVKKWYGVYIYLRDHSFRLDPTHVREYSSVEEFTELIDSNRLNTLTTATSPVMFPISDLAVRAMIATGLVEPSVGVYYENKVFHKIRRLTIPVVGYSIIEVLAEKVD